jgi:guanylate cyclase
LIARLRFIGRGMLGRLVERVTQLHDDPDLKLRKSLLMQVSFGWILAGAIPLAYSAFSLLSFLGFLATRRYDLYLGAQLVLILLLPFLLLVALGGFVNSSAVVLWSVLCPMAALVFDRPERAPGWLLLYLGLLILGGALQP